MKPQELVLEALPEAVKALGLEAYRTGNSGNLIRLRDEHGCCYCPVTAVAMHKTGRKWNCESVYMAGQSLGLSRDETFEVADSADESLCYSTYSSLIRAQLLTVLDFQRGGDDAAT